MKNQIVASGHKKWKNHESHRARRLALWRSIRTKHDDEYFRAGLFGKIALRWRMHVEYRREWKKFAPTPYALHLGAPCA